MQFIRVFLAVPHYSVDFNDILESITVELQIEKKSRNIILSCSYRAPGSSIQCCSDFIEKLLHTTTHKSVYIVGDSNIDILKQASHVPTKYFLNMLYSYGVFPQINKTNPCYVFFFYYY